MQCEICGAEVTRHPRAKTCSTACRNRKRADYMMNLYYTDHETTKSSRRKGIAPRVCTVCGDEYTPTGHGQKACEKPECKKVLVNARWQNRIHSNTQARVYGNMGCAIWHSIRARKAGRKWESIVGYTVHELMAHLEAQFTEGMSWENYGRNGWHIDHIVPKSWFSEEQFTECWSLSNLQPLWEHDNCSKRDLRRKRVA